MTASSSRWAYPANSDRARREVRIRPSRGLLASVAVLGVTTAGAMDIEHDPPVAPISADPQTPNTWMLRTPALSLLVEARTASLIALAPAGSSNLLESAGLTSAPGRGARPSGWIWPVPESSWPMLRAQGWWPETVFNAPLWTGRAWRARSGAAFCRWSREFGPPLSVRATRTIRVSPYAASIEIEDRWERTADSPIPVGPACVVRFANPVRLMLPAPDAPAPVRPIAFDPPPGFSWLTVGGVWVYRPDLGGEHRVESAATDRLWGAVELPGWIVLLRAAPRPDREPPRLRPRAYTHRAARVAELELAAEGAELPAGAVRVTSFLIECFQIAPRLSAEALATRARLLAGEAETTESAR